MAKTSDLMGLGMAGALAQIIGHNQTPNPGTAGGLATTGTVQTATPTLGVTSSTTLAPTTGNTAYTLPVAGTVAKEFFLYNPTATAALLFPSLGGSINGGAANASFTIPANSFVIAVMASMNGGVAQWFAK
jgi:hypothetical protein